MWENASSLARARSIRTCHPSTTSSASPPALPPRALPWNTSSFNWLFRQLCNRFTPTLLFCHPAAHLHLLIASPLRGFPTLPTYPLVIGNTLWSTLFHGYATH